jgi:hypothetical protein
MCNLTRHITALHTLHDTDITDCVRHSCYFQSMITVPRDPKPVGVKTNHGQSVYACYRYSVLCSLNNEQMLRLLENRSLMKIFVPNTWEVTRYWRKFYNDDKLRDLY